MIGCGGRERVWRMWVEASTGVVYGGIVWSRRFPLYLLVAPVVAVGGTIGCVPAAKTLLPDVTSWTTPSGSCGGDTTDLVVRLPWTIPPPILTGREGFGRIARAWPS